MEGETCTVETFRKPLTCGGMEENSFQVRLPASLQPSVALSETSLAQHGTCGFGVHYKEESPYAAGKQTTQWKELGSLVGVVNTPV